MPQTRILLQLQYLHALLECLKRFPQFFFGGRHDAPLVVARVYCPSEATAWQFARFLSPSCCPLSPVRREENLHRRADFAFPLAGPNGPPGKPGECWVIRNYSPRRRRERRGRDLKNTRLNS